MPITISVRKKGKLTQANVLKYVLHVSVNKTTKGQNLHEVSNENVKKKKKRRNVCACV